jgi:predicted MPP superfamily phosphohydrolase
MRGNFTLISIFILAFLLIDIYVFQGLKVLVHHFSPNLRRIIYIIYWLITIISITGFLMFNLGNPDKWSKLWRTFIFALVVVNYIPKIFFVVFLLVGDLIRLFQWIGQKISLLFEKRPLSEGKPIPRSEFLMKAGLIIAAVPFFSMAYGIIFGAHDYRVRRVKVSLKDLPPSFDGLTIAQISDIHSGSFYNKSAVERGVQMVIDQKADVVFFTGDLVNNIASEIDDYIDIFGKIKAPLGVYSTLGNHDYGEYVHWPSPEAKVANVQSLINAHKAMGWDILMNENRILEKNGEKIAILGIENWGGGRWPKYGKLDKAYKGTENIPVKLLLSHDPSHWDLQVRKDYKDINMMFAGHTHGLQFGIEIPGIKWSPSKYFYKQWAGLYKEGEQYLYVNRGFGFIGFPGRVGMPPEITIFELKRA